MRRDQPHRAGEPTGRLPRWSAKPVPLPVGQDTLREGPSLDAYRTRMPVCGLSHAEQVSRWPMLSEALDRHQTPVLLHAFAMRPDTEVLGVLGRIDSADEADQLWVARDQVSQATGMVVAQLRIAPSDALTLLRAHAFAHGTTVIEVSRGVLDRTLDFTAEGPRDAR